MKINGKIVLTLVTLSISVVQLSFAGPREQAKRIHDRLTGVPATNAILDAMESRLGSDPSGKTAADYAIDASQNPNAKSFYNVTLKNFASPWTNEAQDVFVDLNDYSATVIGLIRDGEDFRQVLHGDVIYKGSAAYSMTDNTHYENLEASNADLSNTSVLQKNVQSNVITGLPTDATAGVLTTRAAARAFFIDGTNRAMFRFTMLNHMCTDLEPLKDVSRTPDRVRQDTSRSPGGDSRIYLNNCVGCHAGMDGMAGAFAHYQYEYPDGDEDGGQLIYDDTQVQPKYLINAENFKPGYITTGDSWINYWRNGQNSILGWGHSGETLDAKDNAIGNGAKALGIELANSQAFAQCQVDKVFKSVCFRDPNNYAADRGERDIIVSAFKTNYNMKEVFSDVAAWCKGS